MLQELKISIYTNAGFSFDIVDSQFEYVNGRAELQITSVKLSV